MQGQKEERFMQRDKLTTKTKKRFLVLVMACVLVFIFTACNGSQEPAAPAESSVAESAESSAPVAAGSDVKPMKLAGVVKDMTGEYFTENIKGYEEFAADTNGIVTLESFDGQNAPERQVELIETLINSGINGILLNAIDPAATRDVVDRCMAEGIVVMQYPDEENLTSALVFDDYANGHLLGSAAGEWIRDELGGVATVATFAQSETEQTHRRWEGICDGVVDICGEENITFIEPVDTLTQDEAYTTMETWLQAYPDCRVVLGVQDTSVIGGYEAVLASGKGNDEWFFGGIDGVSQALDLIKEGGMYKVSVANTDTISENGYWLAQNLARAFYGLDYERQCVVPHMVVTADNVDDYVNQDVTYELDPDFKEFLGV
jgi:ABC-type sugar transport system substrate-binding protein